MKVRAFITHKEQEFYKDCQDRFSVNADTKSVAVSDGMTQSIFPWIWAESLACEYTKDIAWYPSDEAINELSILWYKKVADIIEKETRPGPKRNAKNSLVRGRYAGATLVGIRVEKNKYKGLVLGDSCALHINENNSIESIYTSQDGDFDNFPDHFGSSPTHIRKGEIKEFEFILQPNEKVLLVSDPFSEFLANKKKTNEETSYIGQLLSVSSQEEFESIVDDWRIQGMHNDDATLVVLEYEEKEDWSFQHITDINKLIEEESKAITIAQESKEEEVTPKGEDISIIVPETEKQQTKANETENDVVVLLSSILSFFDKLRQFLPKNKKIKKLKQSMNELIEQIKDYISQCCNQQ